MGRHRHLAGRFGRSHGFRRRFTLALLLLVALGIAAGAHLTRPKRLAALAGVLLTDLTGTDVRIESARLTLSGDIHLGHVEWAVAGLPAQEARLFAARTVQIEHDLWSLLRGRFRARSLVLHDATLYLTEDAATGEFNYHQLQRDRGQSAPMLPGELPEVYLRGGTVQFGEGGAEGYVERGRIRLSGNLTAAGRPGIYFFKLEQERPDASAGPALSGQLDLATMAVEAKVDRFALESPQGVVLPSRLRRWWDQLEPAGSLPTVSFAYDPDRDQGLHAILEVRDVELTLPWGEDRAGNPRPRMQGVTGRFRLAGDTVSVEGLYGQIDNISYEINGRILGLSADAPFRFSVRIDPFEVHDEPRYAIPEAVGTRVHSQFARFSPSGMLRGLVMLERREPGGAVAYDGTVHLSDARLTYDRFPYPLEQVRGEVRFDERVVEIAHLTGLGPSGAMVSLRGEIDVRVGDGPAGEPEPPQVHLVITAAEVPIDEPLREAVMAVEERPDLLEVFLSRQHEARLVDEGVIQSAAQRAQRLARLRWLEAAGEPLADAPFHPLAPAVAAALEIQAAALKPLAAVPVFDLGGKVNISVDVSRPHGEPKYTTRVSLDPAGTDVLLGDWPYPLHLTGGSVVITETTALIENVEGEGLSGARLRFNGKVEAPPEGPFALDLRVVGARIPLDALLLGSVDQPQRQWLAGLNLTGSAEVAGAIFREPAGKLGYRLEVQLAEASAAPFGPRLRAEQLEATLILQPGRAVIEAARARWGDAAVALSGSAAWRQPQAPELQLDLELAGSHVPLDEALLDVLGPDSPLAAQTRRLLADYGLRGTADLALSYRQQGGAPPAWRLSVRPTALAFQFEGHGVELDEFAGALALDPAGLHLTSFSAAGAGMRGTASGSLSLAAVPELALDFELEGDGHDFIAQAILPRLSGTLLKDLKLAGGYGVGDGRLTYRPAATSGHRTELAGVLRLHDASAAVGLPITGLSGELDFAAAYPVGDGRPTLELHLRAAQMRLGERLLAPLSLRLASGKRPDMLELRDLHGTIYGGTLHGDGTLDLADGGRYRLHLALQDAELGPMIHPPGDEPAGRQGLRGERTPSAGLLSAQLSLEGLPADERARRGRGQFEIHHANLYELPVGMAMLQILNLSLPVARSFDRASAEFLIDGDAVRFDSIRFDAPNLQIVGGGTMRYRSRELDLSFYSRNPRAPDLGLVGDLVGGLKDALVGIQVSGTLEEPRSQLRPLGGVRKSWQEIIGQPRRISRAVEE